MNFIIENWEALVALVLALHGAALIIVNLTPTPKDNEALAKIYPFIQFLAGLVSEKSKGKEGGSDAGRTGSGS